MIPKDCKRLAEVDFPIAVVSKNSAREKSIRHGHPSTLHLWWARRPLAACRAMLLGLLLPDPVDDLCPKEFKAQARKLLQKVPGKIGVKDIDLRESLLRFIGEFSNWDLSANSTYLEVGRGLVKAAHPEETPLVVDPFAGGGSIPLEALRLGCETFATDLNPVACLILKVMLEDIPRHGSALAEELRKVGAKIKAEAEKELAEFYPDDPDGAKPIAYLWARTIRCEAPNCGAEIPLMRSLWLCKKAIRRKALKLNIERLKGQPPQVRFEIHEPKSEKNIAPGTVARAKATCLGCGTVLPPERVRTQLSEQHGGADVIFDKKGNRTGGARFLAVVTLKDGQSGRQYRLAHEEDYKAVFKAQKRLKAILKEWDNGGKKGLCPVPDEAISLNELRRISVPIYGMKTWGNIFNARQNTALVMLSKAVKSHGGSGSSKTQAMMGIVVDRCADYWSSLCSWHLTGEKVNHTFGRQALGMVWDYCEVLPFSGSSGNYEGALEWGVKVVEAWTGSNTGQVQAADAATHPLPNDVANIWFTDPPYYDAVPYAHLSDFFYVWLRRVVSGFNHSAFCSESTPKKEEIVVDRPHSLSSSTKDVAHYEGAIARAFAEGCRVLRRDGIGSVVFAHKTTEGWEALLSGLIKGGWIITGSWPISTEMGARLNARDTASLATSVHLVCRPRPENAPIGDWGEVLKELPKRVGDWMERLESEGVRGADLVFACIGPALEIFSRYERVERPDGTEVNLAEYLQKVWEVVGRTALEQVLGTAEAKARNGAAGALEEDARLTALFLWTLQATTQEQAEGGRRKAEEEAEGQEEDADSEDAAEGKPKAKGGYSLIFDIVRRFAQPLGINLPRWEGRIIEIEKGVVRLLPVSERARILFGAEGSRYAAARFEKPSESPQLKLFPDVLATTPPAVRIQGRRGKKAETPTDQEPSQSVVTTLDRIHAAMLLQKGGQTAALRALIGESIEKGPDFIHLSNALSALYPKESEEKRLLDAMLLAVPR